MRVIHWIGEISRQYDELFFVLKNKGKTLTASWNHYLVFFAFLCVQATCCLANGAAIGVLYPQMREPYSKVFDTIITGIEQEIGAAIDRYRIGNQLSVATLETKIQQQQNKLLLALGVRGVKVAQQLSNEVPVVVGAVSPSSFHMEGIKWSGISLLPDPEIMLTRLSGFVPRIKIVSVVYNPDNNQFLIDKTIAAGKSMGITIDARPAHDIRDAALIYKNLFQAIDHRSNAIWLVQDAATLDKDVVLPLVLEEAWNRNLVTFSNHLIHAKRGALFSMYPNNLQMGKELAKLAESVLAKPGAVGINVLKSLNIAVNTRTAKHLGIKFTMRQEKSFDLVFPQE